MSFLTRLLHGLLQNKFEEVQHLSVPTTVLLAGQSQMPILSINLKLSKKNQTKLIFGSNSWKKAD
jgi:hypothetical protein